MLGKGATKAVLSAVDKLFDKIKVRFLGHKLVDKALAIRVATDVTLPGLYEAAVSANGAKPSDTTLNAILNVAEGYLEAQRERSKAQVLRQVNSFLEEAKSSGVDTNAETVLGGQLAQTFERITNDVHTIVDAEAQSGRNLGALEGVLQVNAASGINDPVVYFVVVRDGALCSECKRLHLLDDETTPRLWYFSEVGHGHHKRGEENPKAEGLHPHCRCSMATLMPGYGFDGGGMVTYVKNGHQEILAQRHMEKAEDLDDLIARLEKHEAAGCEVPELAFALAPDQDLDDFIASCSKTPESP